MSRRGKTGVRFLHGSPFFKRLRGKLNPQDILEQLDYLLIYRGLPRLIRSDNKYPDFTAKSDRNWLERLGVQTMLIEPGSPYENRYNQFRPHSALIYRPPAPETIKPKVEILTEEDGLIGTLKKHFIIL
jgi:transposase InsO family protein